MAGRLLLARAPPEFAEHGCELAIGLLTLGQRARTEFGDTAEVGAGEELVLAPPREVGVGSLPQRIEPVGFSPAFTTAVSSSAPNSAVRVRKQSCLSVKNS